ncbi:hypothetical protein [Promicromonospora iranensis]|uniref:SMODS and SLOG-associating 2TM effector domain-containing protein n=1 Tax=Promicromonospora iranensis TaxID=1105144 RepID=A0ABU2CQG5_9MICO|nr:hypothetical protein [Promicromonospora iranensis]MDR7383586.1 hypothetical protein [Promicromonospora iranensis]
MRAQLRLLRRQVRVAWSSRRWARRRRVVVAVITYALLGVAFVLGILWILGIGPEWEPWVNSLTLLAGVTGLVVERQNAETERRSEVVASVVFELQQNRAIVERRLAGLRTGGERALSVSPRLALSAVDAALASGVLSRTPDSSLVGKLHRWREQVQGYNWRRDLTEFELMLIKYQDDADAGSNLSSLANERLYLLRLRTLLDQLHLALPQV